MSLSRTDAEFDSRSESPRALAEEAWRARVENFPRELTLSRPVETKTVSVTGTKCELNCAHCGGHYLKGMTPIVEAAAESPGSSIKSYLISGGYTREGKVPFFDRMDELYSLKKRGRLNFHVGLVSKEEARLLRELADAVSFDFVGDDRLVREAYGLSFRVSDYLKSYLYLIETLGVERVVPHITVGLYRGQIGSELRAAELLAGAGLSRLVLLIFTPTRGTLYAACRPPHPEDVGKLIARIRLALPSTPLYLGCMRPGGQYRAEVDKIAVKCGINKIVTPAPGTAEYARSRGLKIIQGKECCVL